MAWGISDNFDRQRVSVLICQDCMYIKIFIILEIKCFHSDSHYTITDWWWTV